MGGRSDCKEETTGSSQVWKKWERYRCSFETNNKEQTGARTRAIS